MTTETAAATSPPDASSRNPRFPHLDALRALAALSVLLYHVEIIGPTYHVAVAGGLLGRALNRGSDGIVVFFVISGFVLYRPFVASRHRQARRPAVRTYLRRRFLRIFPGYWLALTVLTLAFSLPGVFTHDWWRYYGLLQIYDPRTDARGMNVAWTLCLEMSFYLVLPLYALLADRIAATFKREMLLLSGLAVASFVWTVLVAEGKVHGQFVYYVQLLAVFDWFALGMMLAALSVRGCRVPAWSAWLGCLGALVLVIALPHEIGRGGLQPAAGLLGAAAVALAVLTPNPPRILVWKPLAWLGVVSYGIYLWHASLIPPAIHHVPTHSFVAVAIATMVTSICAAALSYYLIERRAMAWRPKPLGPRLRTAIFGRPVAGPTAETAQAPASATD